MNFKNCSLVRADKVYTFDKTSQVDLCYSGYGCPALSQVSINVDIS